MMNQWLNKNIVYRTALLLRGEWLYPHLRTLAKTQWISGDALRELQEKRLIALCKTAKRYSEYYRRTLPDKISLSNLSAVGFVDKSLLREKCHELRGVRSRFDRSKTTGGSTGAAVTLYKNPRAMAEELAATWRGYGWAKVHIGDKQVRFWGVPISEKDHRRSRLIDFVCNRTRISAFSRDLSAWKKALLHLESVQADYFYGYVSMIKEFAEFVEENEHTLQPKAIITTSEVLTKMDKEAIGATFQCPVFDEYGCGEVGTIAHECEHGRLHINAENMIVEIIDSAGKPAPAGQSGELVVTDLSNIATPLIRYKMADWGSLSMEMCPCGRTLPVLETIYGRAYDSLISTSGLKYHGEFFLYLIEDANKLGMKVDGVQFVQVGPAAIRVHLVCDPQNFTAIQEYLIRRLSNDFDAHFKIDFFLVPRIEREKSGKLRVVKRDY